MKASQKPFFTAKSWVSNGGYKHAGISLYAPSEYDTSSRRPFLELEWQSDNGNTGWYGFHAESRTDSSVGLGAVEQFKQAAVIMAKVAARDPIPFAGQLMALGIERLAYDSRVSRYLPIDEVKPAEFKRFMSLDGGRGCLASCLATDEADAKGKLLMEMGRRIAEPGWSSAEKRQEDLADWMKRGQPVEADRFAEAPDVSDLAELFKPLGKTEELGKEVA